MNSNPNNNFLVYIQGKEQPIAYLFKLISKLVKKNKIINF